jgi:methylase of polypeptide subunit release factors
LPKLKKIDTEDPQDFYQKLTHLFEYVRKEIDYEAIFGPNEVLDKIPLPKMLVFTLNDFIEELGTYNLSKIRSEVIGRVYEELIPENERHRLGQYYTPPPIIELITEMCIKSPNDRILDPACGSGGFLIKAYHKLSDLKKKENPFENDDKLHEEILNQLYGVEINPFPAQLSSINLAVRDLRVTSKNINLIVSDFFKVDQFAGVTPEKFSVVVTNPPYTDWREMENRCSIRETALNYKDDVTIDIGKQAGVYAYFFTQAAKFLQDGGRMGMIVSDAWLDMDYGIGLKEFFLNFFKIKAIIGSATGVFDEPLVNTVIVILEKCENDPKAREENTVVFCKLKKSIEIKKAINSVTDAKESFDQDSLRVEIIRQGNLESESLWGLYLRAPRLYFELARNPMITELKSVSAKTRIGLQTFADKFYIVSKDTAKTWGIEQKYLRKIITSPKLISKVTLGSKEVNEFVILCSDKKENLRDENILRYIEWGESTEVKVRKKDRTVTGFQKLPRVQKTNREPWYNVKQDINSKGVAAILYPYMAWNKITFVWNPEGVLDHQNFIGIIPKTQDSTIPLLAVLNSSLSEFIVRCTSHIYGGGVAKLKPGDIKKIKVVNIEKISKEESELLTRLFQDIIDEKENSKQALDDAIFKILKLNEKKKAKIFETIKELRNAQIVRKEVDVLVQTADRWKSHKKPKKEKIVRLEPSKKLDKWME